MTEQVEKKDLTQEQVETILKGQFKDTQIWEFFLLVCFVFIPIIAFGLMGLSFHTLPLAFKIVWWIVTAIAFWKCEAWVIERRVRKTIQAMRDM